MRAIKYNISTNLRTKLWYRYINVCRSSHIISTLYVIINFVAHLAWRTRIWNSERPRSWPGAGNLRGRRARPWSRSDFWTWARPWSRWGSSKHQNGRARPVGRCGTPQKTGSLCYTCPRAFLKKTTRCCWLTKLQKKKRLTSARKVLVVAGVDGVFSGLVCPEFQGEQCVFAPGNVGVHVDLVQVLGQVCKTFSANGTQIHLTSKMFELKYTFAYILNAFLDANDFKFECHQN